MTRVQGANLLTFFSIAAPATRARPNVSPVASDDADEGMAVEAGGGQGGSAGVQEGSGKVPDSAGEEADRKRLRADATAGLLAAISMREVDELQKVDTTHPV